MKTLLILLTDEDTNSILFFTRRQIRVSKHFIHESFKESSNDIALIRLGKKNLFGDPLDVSFLITTNSQKTEWISHSSALSVFLMLVKGSLTRMGMSMVSSSLISYGSYTLSQAGETLESKTPPQTSCRRL